MNLFLYLTFYFLITLSITGHGLLFQTIFFKKDRANLGYCGLYGIFFLTIFSYFTNFFIANNQISNLIILLLGIIFFIYFIFIKFKLFNNNLLIFFLIFLILILFILTPKTHDDFQYYHFPYIHLLTVEPSSIGLGNFNHGFRTHSSIFYFSSLFFLPIIEYDIIHITPVFFLGFVNYIFLNKILKNIKDNKNFYIIFLSLLSFSFINIFFYRLAEHGTDRSSMILILLVITELIQFINNEKSKNIIINRMLILIFLTISLKAFYLIYLIFIIPIIYYQKDKIKFLIKLFKNRLIYLSFVLLFFVLSTNFINTGCIIYPLSQTCFSNLIWSIPIQDVQAMNEWYQLWSKGGATPNFRVEDPKNYINNFNWLDNWVSIYFFNKISDFIIGILFLTLIIFFLFKEKITYKVSKKNFLFIYLIIFFLLIEWFIYHPALRYGGYHLIALIIFIPISIFLSKKSLINKNFIKKVIVIICLVTTIFISRNIYRLSDEIKIYNYNFIENPTYKEKFKNFDIYKTIIKAKKNCKDNNPCNKNEFETKKKYNKTLFYKIK